jgi:outer membrane lipopolysaccharide assembly protein LptE/RlpB
MRRRVGWPRRWGIGLMAACVLAGCGYRPLGETGAPAGRRTVLVQAIGNETLRPGLQGIVGAALLRQLRLQGIAGSPDAGSADLVLSGGVTGYLNDAITFSGQDIGRRFRIRLTVSVTLTRPADGSVRLAEAVLGEAFYTTGTDAVTTRNAEEEAVRRAAQDMAFRLVARIMEEW